MLHRTFGRKLNRDVKERKALYRSLAISLIKFGRIETTVEKAKTVKRIIEKLVTKAKKDTNISRQKVTAFLVQKAAIERLLKVIAVSMKDKNGGSIRIRKIGKRTGDGAEMVRMEWSTEITEIKESKKPGRKTKEVKKVEKK